MDDCTKVLVYGCLEYVDYQWEVPFSNLGG